MRSELTRSPWAQRHRGKFCNTFGILRWSRYSSLGKDFVGVPRRGRRLFQMLAAVEHKIREDIMGCVRTHGWKIELKTEPPGAQWNKSTFQLPLLLVLAISASGLPFIVGHFVCLLSVPRGGVENDQL